MDPATNNLAQCKIRQSFRSGTVAEEEDLSLHALKHGRQICGDFHLSDSASIANAAGDVLLACHEAEPGGYSIALAAAP